MIPVDTSLLMKEAKEIEENACGDYCVVTTKTGAKFVKLLNFDQFYRHTVFINDENGCLEKGARQTIPAEVFYYLG